MPFPESLRQEAAHGMTLPSYPLPWNIKKEVQHALLEAQIPNSFLVGSSFLVCSIPESCSGGTPISWTVILGWVEDWAWSFNVFGGPTLFVSACPVCACNKPTCWSTKPKPPCPPGPIGQWILSKVCVPLKVIRSSSLWLTAFSQMTDHLLLSRMPSTKKMLRESFVMSFGSLDFLPGLPVHL